MDVTQNDLCSNTASLDLVALRRSVGFALRAKLEEINQYYCAINNTMFSQEWGKCKLYLDSQYLKRSAEQLEIIAETFYTLNAAKDREVLKLVNEEDFRKLNW